MEARYSRDQLRIPDVVQELCFKRVMVMEFMEGEKIDEFLRAHPERAPDICSRIAELYGTMIFFDGFYHGDPHPGNWLIDGEVGKETMIMLDFGQSQELTIEVRIILSYLAIALSEDNGPQIARRMRELHWETTNNYDTTFINLGKMFYDTKPIDEPMGFVIALEKITKEDPIVKQPGTTAFINKVTMLLRGVFTIYDAKISISDMWVPYAKQCLAQLEKK